MTATCLTNVDGKATQVTRWITCGAPPSSGLEKRQSRGISARCIVLFLSTVVKGKEEIGDAEGPFVDPLPLQAGGGLKTRSSFALQFLLQGEAGRVKMRSMVAFTVLNPLQVAVVKKDMLGTNALLLCESRCKKQPTGQQA